jgi:hypothetical protein
MPLIETLTSNHPVNPKCSIDTLKIYTMVTKNEVKSCAGALDRCRTSGTATVTGEVGERVQLAGHLLIDRERPFTVGLAKPSLQ